MSTKGRCLEYKKEQLQQELLVRLWQLDVIEDASLSLLLATEI